MINESADRITKISKFYSQFTISVKSNLTQETDFSSFKMERTKKNSNNKREIIQNNDLFDLLTNFKHEFDELEEKKLQLEKIVTLTIAKKILFEDIRPFSEIVAKTTNLITNEKIKIERMEVQIMNEFEKVKEEFLKTMEYQMEKGYKKQRSWDRRVLFEKLASFLCLSKDHVDSLKGAYCSGLISLFEEAKSLENKRVLAIKSSTELFLRAVSNVFGDGTKYFGVSKYLVESLENAKITEFLFDLNTLLLPSEIDLISRLSKSNDINSGSYLNFLKTFDKDEVMSLINSMTVRQFKGVLLENDGKRVNCIIYSTIENTFVVYKQTHKIFYVATIFPEDLEIELNMKNGFYGFNFEEKGVIWNMKRSVNFIFQSETANMIAFAKERAMQILRCDSSYSGNVKENVLAYEEIKNMEDFNQNKQEEHGF